VTASKERPFLHCPECDAPLIAADSRGRHDDAGNEIMHGLDCRCRWCDWWWWDTGESVPCKCGAQVRVLVDEGHAYASACGVGT